MKKIFLLMLWAQAALAQTDSSATLKTIVKDDVVVSATRAKENSPTTYQYISKEELNKNNLGQDLPFLLDQTPSVVTTSDAGAGVGYTGIRIRGSDATRVNVTLNGIPVNDAESQGTYWVDLPDVASSIQSIQIQRGVGASTNGGSSFGGTLSLQTLSPSEKSFGEATVAAGSFGTFKINGKIGTGLRKGFFAEGGVSWVTSDGYIDRASSNLISWFTQIGYLRNRTLLKLVYFAGQEKTYQAWDGVPEDSLKTNRRFNDLGTDYGQHFPPYKNQTDNYNQDYFQLLFAQGIGRYVQLHAGIFATLGHGYYEEYKVGQTFNDYFLNHDTLGITTDLVRQKWLQNIFSGGTFSLAYQRNHFSATFGGLYGRYDGKHFGKVIWADGISDLDNNRHYYDGKSLKNDFNVYAKFDYELARKVVLYLDLQYRYVGYSTHGEEDDHNPYSVSKQWHFFNPKAGVLYKIRPQHHIYASYALGNREPNRDDVLAAERTGRPAKPEMMHNVEAGYKFLDGRFPFQINYYLMQYKDQLVLTGKLNDVGNPIKENVASSYRTGVELSGRFIFYKGKENTRFNAESPSVEMPASRVFSINYSFTYALNKIKSFDEYIYTYDENYSPVDSLTQVITHKNTTISFSPSIIASLELAAYPVKGLEIALMTKAVSKQYLDNTSSESRKIKPFTYSNLRIAYKLPLNRADKEIRFTLLLNNIFNRLYESNGYTYSERYTYVDENNQTQVTPTSTYNYYNPQAGFNFLAGMSVRF